MPAKKATSHTIPGLKKEAVRDFLKKHKIHPAQKKLMEGAGFKIDMIQRDGRITWKRGDILVGTSHNKTLTVKKLVELVVIQANYWTKRNTSINHGEASV